MFSEVLILTIGFIVVNLVVLVTPRLRQFSDRVYLIGYILIICYWILFLAAYRGNCDYGGRGGDWLSWPGVVPCPFGEYLNLSGGPFIYALTIPLIVRLLRGLLNRRSWTRRQQVRDAARGGNQA
jgi:hypothetical protein